MKDRASYYVLYVILGIILIALAIFFLGGHAQGDAVIGTAATGLWQPARTDILLYLVFVLFGITVLAMAGSALFHFNRVRKENPKGTIKLLVGLLFMAVLFSASWVIGSGVPLSIQGYGGIDNTPFWNKISDMFFFTICTLLAIAIILIIGNSIKKHLPFI